MVVFWPVDGNTDTSDLPHATFILILNYLTSWPSQ